MPHLFLKFSSLDTNLLQPMIHCFKKISTLRWITKDHSHPTAQTGHLQIPCNSWHTGFRNLSAWKQNSCRSLATHDTQVLEIFLFWIQNSWNPCHTYLRNLVWIETFCNSCTLNLDIFKFEMIWTQTLEERSNSSSDIYGISACNMGS